MRPRTRATRHRHPASEPRYSLWGTALASVVALGAIFLALLAASAPAAAAAATGAVVVTVASGRALLRRRRRGRARRICLPRTRVCVVV